MTILLRAATLSSSAVLVIAPVCSPLIFFLIKFQKRTSRFVDTYSIPIEICILSVFIDIGTLKIPTFTDSSVQTINSNGTL